MACILGISRPSAHHDGIPFSGRPAHTVWMKVCSFGIVPPFLSDTTRAGAKEVPTPYSPWHREQLSSNCFQPRYALWEIVSRGALWNSLKYPCPSLVVSAP